MAGFDERDSTSLQRPTEDYSRDLNQPLAGLRIGLPKEFFGEGCDAEVMAAVAVTEPEYVWFAPEYPKVPDHTPLLNVIPGGRTSSTPSAQDTVPVWFAVVAGSLGCYVTKLVGYLLSPPFCDPHFHMDSTLSYGLPRVNESGTLLEGIALWGELKPTLTADAIIERALTYCDWAVAKGLLAIRSHVDTSDPSLLAVEALLEVKRRVAPYLDLQLVAFPQDGVLRTEGGVDNLKRALDHCISMKEKGSSHVES